jgi:hypothetical protein
MNKHIVVLVFLGIFGMFAAGACEVSAGIGGDDGSCEDLTCADALTSGLAAQGDSLCDEDSDSDYSDVVNCGCDPSNCEDECGDNLCSDLGASDDCNDCLSQNCPAEQTACIND